MDSLTKSGLTSAATCFLKAAEVMDEVSTIKIVSQPQYGRPVAGDAQYKGAIQLYTRAAAKFRSAGMRYARGDFEGGARLNQTGKALATRAEAEYQKGYKASTGD